MYFLLFFIDFSCLFYLSHFVYTLTKIVYAFHYWCKCTECVLPTALCVQVFREKYQNEVPIGKDKKIPKNDETSDDQEHIGDPIIKNDDDLQKSDGDTCREVMVMTCREMMVK